MSSLSWRRFALAVWLTVGSVGAAPALAAPPEKAEKIPAKTQVTVMVIHAHNDNKKVDPQLKSVQRQLQFMQFTGFTLLDSYPANLLEDGEETFQIAGGRRLKVALVGRNDEKARLRLRMFGKKGKVLDTTVSIQRDRAFMVAGPNHNDGKLVIAVRVKY